MRPLFVAQWFDVLYNTSMAKLDNPEVLRELYINQRLDTGDIAEQLKVGYNTVVRALAKYGIKKEQRFPKAFTPEQSSVLYGSMLGDANLSIQKKGTNACLRMEHGMKQKDWLQWKFEHFRPWLNAEEPTIVANRSTNGVVTPSIKFTTVATPLFTEVYHQFYQDGKKLVTKTVMDKIDALALAVWFQDDGTYFYNSASRSNTMRIATHSFTKFEQEILCAYFRTKWAINPDIRHEKNGSNFYYFLNFRASDAQSIVEIIRPFVIPSLAYKLDPRLKSNMESSEVS